MRFAMLLTVLFIGLKLTNYIDWSWFWVLSPMPISFLFGLLLVGLLAAILYYNDTAKKSYLSSFKSELEKLNQDK